MAPAAATTIKGQGYITFDGLGFQGINVGGATATGITFRNGSIRYGDDYANNNVFVNMSIGNWNGSYPFQVGGNDGMQFIRDTFANATLTACNGALSGQSTNYYCHGDGVYIGNCTNTLFDEDTFNNNSVFQIFFSHGAASGTLGHCPGPVTIRNSMFGWLDRPSSEYRSAATRATNSPATRSSTTRVLPWTIGVNSGKTGVRFSNWVVSNNIGVAVPCSPPTGMSLYGVTFTNNVLFGTTCTSSVGSPTAKNNIGGVTPSSLFVQPTGANLHLLSANTPADGIGDPAACPAADFDDQPRALRCDAGADEVGTRTP